MKRLLTSAVLFLCCTAISFAQFSGSGSGTENDPYLILNPIQLNQVRNFLNNNNVYFKLMSDIDLTDYIEDEDPYQGWQPIGTSNYPFAGIFDGNGKTVSGLIINRPNDDDIGLFAKIASATIKNLKMDNCTIKGNNRVGILTGNAIGSSIFNCTINGVIDCNTKCR